MAQLNFSALWPYWPELLSGLWVTIQLTLMATVGGVALGILGAALRSGRPSILSRLWGVYVELIRNTPFVVQLFFIVFGLPNLGVKLTAGEAALLAMLINLGAYSTEIIRAGIQSVGQGQLEAAKALGYRPGQIFRQTVLPQAMRTILPPAGNEVIGQLKTTAVVSVIALQDVLYSAQIIYQRTYEVLSLIHI